MKEKVDWVAVLAEWSASGMSKKKFCEQRGLRYQSFMYHHKRDFGRDTRYDFAQVRMDSAPHSARIDYHFRDGRKVSFPLGTPRDLVRFLVSL